MVQGKLSTCLENLAEDTTTYYPQKIPKRSLQSIKGLLVSPLLLPIFPTWPPRAQLELAHPSLVALGENIIIPFPIVPKEDYAPHLPSISPNFEWNPLAPTS